MVSVVPVKNSLDYLCALSLRKEAYNSAGKLSADNDELISFSCSVDPYSLIYIIYNLGEAIGTFSIAPSNVLDIFLMDDRHKRFIKNATIFIHSLCVREQKRTSSVLKFIFAKVFECLVLLRCKYIAVLADRKMAVKYRFIGFKRTGLFYKSRFINVGLVELLITKQKKFGIYGAHADPLRWNMYLREPTMRLIRSHKNRFSFIGLLLFKIYALFYWPSVLFEKLLKRYLSYCVHHQTHMEMQHVREI